MILRKLIMVLGLASGITSTLFAGTDRGDRLIGEAGGAAGLQGIQGIPGAPGVLDFSDFFA